MNFRVVYFVLLSLFLGIGAPPRPADAQQAPDIILVNLDDWSQISNRRFLNSNVGALTLQNAVEEFGLNYCDFSSCYVAQPSCSPSRAALLRCQWPRRTGIVFNGPRPVEENNGGLEGFVGRRLHLSNIATWLGRAGYRTAHVGKFLNYLDRISPRPPATPSELGVAPLPGWDDWYNIQRLGFGGYQNFTMSENGSLVRYDSETYSTDLFRDYALQIISDTPSDEPLFLHFCPTAPHAPAVPAHRHRETRQFLRVPQPPSNPPYLENDVSDKPLYVRARAIILPSIIDEQDAYYRHAANCLNYN